jgi:hypothetical protein
VQSTTIPLCFRPVLASLESTGGDPVAVAVSLSPDGKAGESYGRPGERTRITIAALLGTPVLATGRLLVLGCLSYLGDWDGFLIGAQALLLVLIHPYAEKANLLEDWAYYLVLAAMPLSVTVKRS